MPQYLCASAIRAIFLRKEEAPVFIEKMKKDEVITVSRIKLPHKKAKR